MDDQKKLAAQKLDELIGLARGLSADGQINQEEVEYLAKWLAAHSQVMNRPMTAALSRRVSEILADGVADEEERAELLATLRRFSGNDFEMGESFPSAVLDFDSLDEGFRFAGRTFCLTGVFLHGPRRACESAIKERGGSLHVALTQATDYLVVGAYASEDWKHSAFGTKIIKAIEYRDRWRRLRILPEDAWRRALVERGDP